MLTPFFEAVLPRVGHLALFSLSNKQHVWAQTIPELVQDVEQRSEQQGVYFATASFWQPSNRTQDNVQALRALRLDIDAGAAKFKKHPDGAYPTQQDALRAVMAFTSAHKLKPSYIISSGEGLHIYYCLTDDAAPEVWMPLASRLGQLCAESGLRADNSVTCDTARVLRPPGTLHPNGQRVAVLGSSGRVYTLEEIRQRLGVAPPSETDIAFAGAETRKFNLAVNEDVRAVEGPPKSIHKISAHCGAVNEAAASRGDVPEPYWRAMIGIVKFTVEGREMAHELSRGHEDYDSGETDRKFDAYGAGPTTDRKSTRLNSSHLRLSRMPSSA